MRATPRVLIAALFVCAVLIAASCGSGGGPATYGTGAPTSVESPMPVSNTPTVPVGGTPAASPVASPTP